MQVIAAPLLNYSWRWHCCSSATQLRKYAGTCDCDCEQASVWLWAWTGEGLVLLAARAGSRADPLVQEERLDGAVDVVGALQLQRVPCVPDDL